MSTDHTASTPSTDSTDELLVRDALQRQHLDTPDLTSLAAGARRTGGRVRRRRQALTCVAAAAVVGLGSVGLAVASGARDAGGAGSAPGFAGAPTASSTWIPVPPPQSLPLPGFTKVCLATLPARDAEGRPSALEPTGAGGCGRSHHRTPFDLATAYAVLDAPGWTAPDDNVIADDKLYYVGPGDSSLSLNWRTAEPGSAAKYATGAPVATTTIDGDAAKVYSESGDLTVVGPVRDGRFLTLDSATLTLDQLVDLAPRVHRQ